MKKLALVLAGLLALAGIAGGCGSSTGSKPAGGDKKVVLKVGASPVPHAEILEKAGLLKLKEGVGVLATANDIVDNPKNLKITEAEAAMLPRTLDDVDLAVINSNFAMEAKLNPTKDALFIEAKDSPYANIVAIRKGDENRPEIQKLMKALNSPEVKKFIEEKYQGAIIPAF